MKAETIGSFTAEGCDTETMSNAEAEIVIKTIYRPDSRFLSLGTIDADVAKSDAIVKVVKAVQSKGIENIANLEGFVHAAKTNAHRDVARKYLVKKADGTTGSIGFERRIISGDVKSDDEEGCGSTIIENVESNGHTPADEMERRDMSQLLSRIDAELLKLPKQKAAVFRMVANGYSALQVARFVLHSKVQDTDTAVVKKIEQNRIACIVDRVRRRLIDTFGCQAFELGVISKRRMRVR